MSLLRLTRVSNVIELEVKHWLIQKGRWRRRNSGRCRAEIDRAIRRPLRRTLSLLVPTASCLLYKHHHVQRRVCEWD